MKNDGKLFFIQQLFCGGRWESLHETVSKSCALKRIFMVWHGRNSDLFLIKKVKKLKKKSLEKLEMKKRRNGEQIFV